jgi:hypothetical protein
LWLFGAAAPLGTIYSFQMVGAGTGMALGGWPDGLLFDLSGAYTWSIAAAILTTCLGIPLALALRRHSKPPTAKPEAVIRPPPAAGGTQGRAELRLRRSNSDSALATQGSA